jgi:hypothetical protein
MYVHVDRLATSKPSPQHTHAEVKALISLDQKDCTAVPKLLGYGDRVRGEGEYVPGGYVKYVAWTQVAGESD